MSDPIYPLAGNSTTIGDDLKITTTGDTWTTTDDGTITTIPLNGEGGEAGGIIYNNSPYVDSLSGKTYEDIMDEMTTRLNKLEKVAKIDSILIKKLQSEINTLKKKKNKK